MASFRGFPCCSCLAKWLPAYERELLRRGLIKHNLDVFQLTGRAGASAGTHAQGGAFDLAQFSAAQLRVARDMGADATWHRRIGQGFDLDHAHGVLRGCPHNEPARYQIAAVDDGFNGLGKGGRGGRDDGPRPLSGRTWQEGIVWAKQQAAPKTLRIGTWNLALNNPTGLRTWPTRRPRIVKRVRQYRFDVLAVQERPQEPGKWLDGRLIGRDGRPMRRVGSHGRHVYVSRRLRVVDWESWLVEGKRATVVAVSLNGRR